MKNTYFLKSVFTLILCGFFSMTYAGTIYLSATGSDSNDGLTMGTSVKSFSKAHDLASSGDTIMVSGMIDFSIDAGIAMPIGFALTKNLLIQGTSSTTDGFDGKGATQLIKSGGFNLSLSNLKLTGGSASGNGGALLLTGGTVTISKVIFDGNAAAVRGGAISIEPATALTLNFNECVIKNNNSTTEAAAYFYTDAAGTANTVTFTNCAIISNNATTTGAGGYVNNTSGSLQLSYINCTIAKNNSGGNSSAGLFVGNLQGTSNLVLTNCTMTENTCQTAATSGAGIRIATAVNTNGAKVKIYNTIIENNYYPTTGTGKTTTAWTTDFVWQGDGFVAGTTLIIENSLIGRAMATSKWGTSLPGGSTTAATLFPKSICQYVGVVAPSTDITESYIAKFEAFDAATNSYPLSNASFALEYGLTSWLGTGTVVDQLNFPRPSPKCSAGSREKNPTGPSLGAKKFEKNDTVLVFRNASNQIVVTNTKSDNSGSITVYNTLGQIVAKQAVTGTVTTVEKTLNAGVYIVMLNNAGGSYSKKVIIN
jgi:hypothetical protein